jgi:hypothetical protein
MAISTEEALSSYGFVYTMANSIPELKGYLNQAIQNGWTPERLTAAIQSSSWYTSHADTARNLVQLQTTDPATYNQQVANARNLIALKAAALGRAYTDQQLTQLALRTLTENASWDDQRLSELVTNSLGLGHTGEGTLIGSAAEITDHLKQLAQNYGVDVTNDWLNWQVADAQSGRNSVAGVEAIIKARAKAKYPQLAAEIDSGQTVRDIADPYISTLAKTLELSETGITLKDNYIQKALTQRDQAGTAATMPLWQFTRMVRDDPRYDKTTQAKSDAFATLAQVGKDWGFVGASQ